MRPDALLFATLALALCLLCSIPPGLNAAAQLVQPEAFPLFSDDLYYQDLEKSLQESLVYLNKLPPKRRFSVAGRDLDQAHFKKTLNLFLELIRSRPSTVELNRAIRENFLVYRIVPTATQSLEQTESESSSPLLLTGYYQPLFRGSLQKQPPYTYPLYGVPQTLVEQKTAAGTITGRWHERHLIPFWSRKEIEQGSLPAGSELVWLKDPFDAFLVHIQGSALIQLENQSIRALRFAAKNGRPYTSIGAYLVKTGKMRLEEVSMESLRRYLEAHPDERQDILQQNESYIFFTWDEPGPVLGSMNRPLTPGRSVAADQKLYPPGMPAYVRSSIPQVKHGKLTGRQPLTRLLLYRIAVQRLSARTGWICFAAQARQPAR